MSNIEEACEKNYLIVQDYIDAYGFEPGAGSYTPNKKELMLIADAIHGLLAEDDFISTFTAWRNLVDNKETISKLQTENERLSSERDRLIKYYEQLIDECCDYGGKLPERLAQRVCLYEDFVRKLKTLQDTKDDK